jgi:hypothetical protein
MCRKLAGMGMTSIIFEFNHESLLDGNHILFCLRSDIKIMVFHHIPGTLLEAEAGMKKKLAKCNVTKLISHSYGPNFGVRHANGRFL